MNVEKLFKVLVVGGAMMGASSSMAQGEPSFDSETGEEQGRLAFCAPEDEVTCVENEEGELVVRDGLFCCWGTSCSIQE